MAHHCPNCRTRFEKHTDHPENGCVLRTLVACLDDRDTHTEAQLTTILASTDVDSLWTRVGPILDDLASGVFTDTATLVTLTPNEVAVLLAVRDSEYQSGEGRDNVVGHEVWTSYVNPFENRRTFPGVVASLVKKGCLRTGGGSDAANHEAGCDGTTLALTALGYDSIMAHQS